MKTKSRNFIHLSGCIETISKQRLNEPEQLSSTKKSRFLIGNKVLFDTGYRTQRSLRTLIDFR